MSVFPQVTFTEPVVNVPAGLTFVDDTGAEVAFTLLEVGPDGPSLTPRSRRGARRQPPAEDRG